MCPALFGGGGKAKTPQTAPSPEKVADPTEIGATREAEDQSLFGGVPDLRVDRSVTDGGVGSSGTGLSTM